jgi:hypothetical protein
MKFGFTIRVAGLLAMGIMPGGVAAQDSAAAQLPAAAGARPEPRWPMHSMERPAPPVVTPAAAGAPVAPPSDAMVLFGANGLAEWQTDSGEAAPWKTGPGYFEVAPGTGGIRTRAGFGDVQLHVEWMAPPPRGEGQDRGNSGVFLMQRYEVQVLDSWRNRTYADGQAGAIYGQFPPLVNASRPPGEWQAYDIVFRAPVFSGDTVVRPARLTVFHNGVLVQDDMALLGPTSHRRRDPYEPHAAELPISLQDHGAPVRYRNIWVRKLGPAEGK